MAIETLSITYVEGDKDQAEIAERIEALAREKGRICMVYGAGWVDIAHPGDPMPLLKIDGFAVAMGWDVEKVLNDGQLAKALDAA